MTGETKELSQIIQSLIAIGKNLSSEEVVYADIDVKPKRSNAGNSVLISVNRAAAVSIARQMLQLADSGIEGSHFHVDRTNIALDTEHELIVSLGSEPDTPSHYRGRDPK